MVDISECSICLRDYKEEDPDHIPKILKCGDTFCTNCIKTSILNDKKICPVCSSVVNEDIDEMPINKYALEPNKKILCDICLEEFSLDNSEKMPKILKCGHTFCTKCLYDNRKNGKIICIFCRKETTEEVDQLTENKCTEEEIIKELVLNFKYIEEKKLDIHKLDFQFSMGLMGETNGGKTSIIHYFQTGEPFNSALPTIGLDYHYKYVSCKKKTIKITLWDTAGQERFRSMAVGSLRGIHALLLVFSLTPIMNEKEQEEYNNSKGEDKKKIKNDYIEKTFKTVGFWLEQFYQFNQQEKKIIYLIGNKNDDVKNRIIDTKDAKLFAKEHNLKYYETSAKTGKNIKNVFEKLTIELMEAYPHQRRSSKSFYLKENNNNNKSTQEDKCKNC